MRIVEAVQTKIVCLDRDIFIPELNLNKSKEALVKSNDFVYFKRIQSGI